MLMANDNRTADMWAHDGFDYSADVAADDDHLAVDFQDIWDILDENDPQNCSVDISARNVQQGLRELETATSMETDFAEPTAFSQLYNSEVPNSRIGTSYISAESVGNPFIYNHLNEESSSQASFPDRLGLSDWTFPDSCLVSGANSLIHDFPSHGIDYHDESQHLRPNYVPPFGFAPEDRSHDALMEKSYLDNADHLNSSEYTAKMSDKSESVDTASMDTDIPITPWEPPLGYNNLFILNNIDTSSIRNEWEELLSHTPIVNNAEVFANQVANLGAINNGVTTAEESDISIANIKCENNTKIDKGLKPMPEFLPRTSPSMFINENLVSLSKERGNNLVSKSYNGICKKPPATNGSLVAKGLGKLFPPIITSNIIKNLSGRAKDEKNEFSLISKRARQIYDGINTSAQIKPCSLPLNFNCKKDEAVEEIIRPLSSNLQCPKKFNRATQTTAIVNKFQVVEDPDVCIIEGLSAPVPPKNCSVIKKPLINSQRLAISDPLSHVGMGGVKLKANDERLVLRVALQDLSQPKTEASPPDGVMAVPLLRHQRIALSWMVQKETASLHCSGGILADDQGLGKTISTIALIMKERSPTSSAVSPENNEQIKKEMYNLDEDDDCVTVLDGPEQLPESCQDSSDGNSNNPENKNGRPRGGTLVVCPTSVLRQWADELHDKITQKSRLSVLVYHGSSRTKDPFELARYDVVLTTYSIVSMEVPKQPLFDKDDETARNNNSHNVPFSKKRKYPPTSKKNSRKIKENDNSLLELSVRPLARVGWFRVVLDEAQSIKNHRTQVARACWGLRAKRRWCLSGTPIQNAVDDLYSYFRFLRYDPYATYKSFCASIKFPINKNPTTGYKKLQAVLKTVMLRRTKGTLLDGEPIINLPPKTVELKKVEFTDEERDFYCQLESDSRAQFEEYAAAGTVKQNYVNILLMLLRLRQACDHPLLVKINDSNSAWKSSAEVAKKLPREKQISLLTCLEASLAICGLCNDPPEDAVVTSCGHVFCNQCICEHLTGDDNQCPNPNCKDRLSAASFFSRVALKSCLSDDPNREGTPNSSGSEASIKPESSLWDPPFYSSKIKTALEVLKSISNPEPPAVIHEVATLSKKSLDPFEMEEVSDTDMEDTDLNLGSKQLIKVNGEKAIVFSQWTRMLDLLETGLKDSGIQYRRLDGTMSVLARDKAVKEFKTLPEVTVMIMSLKAASLGLNMVAACRVILLDLWWNPTTEDQAVDRAHRIGQTRPVSVLRLTVKDTVEDRILALQQKKREMVASAFGEDETGTEQTRLTVEDLKYLFMA